MVSTNSDLFSSKCLCLIFILKLFVKQKGFSEWLGPNPAHDPRGTSKVCIERSKSIGQGHCYKMASYHVAYKHIGYMHEKYDVKKCGDFGGGGEYAPQVYESITLSFSFSAMFGNHEVFLFRFLKINRITLLLLIWKLYYRIDKHRLNLKTKLLPNKT